MKRFREKMTPIDGEKLRKAILDCGRSVNQLCKQTGLKQQTISANILNNMMGVRKLGIICSAIGAYLEQYITHTVIDEESPDEPGLEATDECRGEIPVDCIRMLQTAADMLKEKNITYSIHVDFGSGLNFSRCNIANVKKRKSPVVSKKRDPALEAESEDIPHEN